MLCGLGHLDLDEGRIAKRRHRVLDDVERLRLGHLAWSAEFGALLRESDCRLLSKTWAKQAQHSIGALLQLGNIVVAVPGLLVRLFDAETFDF